MTLSCPRMVVSRTGGWFVRTPELPPDFMPEEARLVVLAPLDEVADRPDAGPPAILRLSVLGLLEAPDACGVDEAVAAAVVSTLDCAVGRQATASTDTISVVEIAAFLILGSRNLKC